MQLYIYIIDQARGQDGWILAEFSFCVFMDRDEVEVHRGAKRGQDGAILPERAVSLHLTRSRSLPYNNYINIYLTGYTKSYHPMLGQLL